MVWNQLWIPWPPYAEQNQAVFGNSLLEESFSLADEEHFSDIKLVPCNQIIPKVQGPIHINPIKLGEIRKVVGTE